MQVSFDFSMNRCSLFASMSWGSKRVEQMPELLRLIKFCASPEAMTSIVVVWNYGSILPSLLAIPKPALPCSSLHNFQPVHRDPRRLLVRVAHDALDCCFFVGHAPHSGRPMTERQQWWSQTHDILIQYLDQNPSFWMFAAPGGADNVTVFQKGLPSSGNTSLWRDCLGHHDMCLPSTTCIHQGDRGTWTTPDGVHEHCIDYVAIPTAWLSSCTWSQVLDTFDLANVTEDHKAVGLQLQWTSSWTRPVKHAGHVAVDWSSLQTRTNIV